MGKLGGPITHESGPSMVLVKTLTQVTEYQNLVQAVPVVHVLVRFIKFGTNLQKVIKQRKAVCSWKTKSRWTAWTGWTAVDNQRLSEIFSRNRLWTTGASTWTTRYVAHPFRRLNDLSA